MGVDGMGHGRTGQFWWVQEGRVMNARRSKKI